VLILTRKIGESIIVGDNIRVVVLEIRGRQIRLGIEAPAEVVVLREEIVQRLINANLLAASFNIQDAQQAINAFAKTAAGKKTLLSPRPQSPVITVDSKALGPVTVSEDQIITFPSGLPGFPNFRRYALLPDYFKSPFYCLQCVDNPSLVFLVTEPSVLVPDYHPKNGTNNLKELQVTSSSDLQMLVTLSIPPGRPGEMTANLMSPLLINPVQGLGKQVVIDKPQYSHQYPVLATEPDRETHWEISNNAVNDQRSTP